MPLNFRLPKVVIRRRPRTEDKFEGAIGEGLAVPTARRMAPFTPWKFAIGALVLANLAAFFLLVKPVGGSASELEAQLSDQQMQIKRQQITLRAARDLVSKMEGARGEHDRFMQTYFMDRRTMSSTILSEIKNSAATAGLTPKEHSFAFEAIEGTENLGMMTITANYEGAYADLVKFVNLIDRSPRFLIIDNIQAAPQQQGGRLTSRFKINALVRETPRGSGGGTGAPALPVEALPAGPASTKSTDPPVVTARPASLETRP